MILALARQSVLPLSLMLAGCSVNGVGLTDTDVIRSGDATIVTTRVYGVGISTRSRDAGIAVGYARSVLVLPSEPSSPATGHYPFGTVVDTDTAIAVHRRLFGIEATVSAASIGLSLGFSESMRTAPIGPGASTRRTLRFTPDHPDRTQLKLCEGETECSGSDE